MFAKLSPVAAIVCLLGAGAANAAAQASVAAQLLRVDSLLLAQYPPSEPGAVVAIVLNGNLNFVRGYGMADLEANVPMMPETPFNVMSVAKQFTAAGIALLVERGALSLDDDVRQYVPELPDFGTTIRVRHLIHHTSGLRDVGALWTLTGGSPEDVRGRGAHLAMLTRQQHLNFAPGTEYSYSNSGYILLALIIERVSGLSFPEFAARNFFTPLGMQQSAFSAPEPSVPAPEPPSYRRDSTGRWIRMVSRDRRTGASDLVTTVPELAKWIIGLERSQLGGPAFASLLETRGTLANGDSIEYAFGNLIDRHEGFREILHSGGLLGTRCKISRFPQRRVGVIYCGNGSPDYNDTFYAIASILLIDAPLPKARATTSPRRPAATEAARLAVGGAVAGRYVSEELGHDLVIEGAADTLVVRAGSTILARGTVSPADSTLRVNHADLGPLAFHFLPDAAGRWSRLVVSTERVRSLSFRRADP